MAFLDYLAFNLMFILPPIILMICIVPLLEIMSRSLLYDYDKYFPRICMSARTARIKSKLYRLRNKRDNKIDEVIEQSYNPLYLKNYLTADFVNEIIKESVRCGNNYVEGNASIEYYTHEALEKRGYDIWHDSSYHRFKISWEKD